MNLEQRNDIFARILLGKFKYCVFGKTYFVHTPTVELACEAGELYKRILYRESFNDSWLSQQDADLLLVSLKLVPPNVKDVLEEMGKRIDELKIELYESCLNGQRLDKTRKMLNMLRNKANETNASLYSLEYLTARGYASSVMSQFLLVNTTYDENEKRVWNCDFENADYKMLESLKYQSYFHNISYNDIREIAHTEPWRMYWDCKKENIFDNDVFRWTEQQRGLISLSKMYDKIYQSPECPTDNIINDNDLLDGWILLRQKEDLQSKNQKEMDTILGGRHKDANMVLIPASTKEQAEKIDNMNSPSAKMIKKQREEIIKRAGKLNQLDLPDAQLQRRGVKVTYD
jgi:hypothetical protein